MKICTKCGTKKELTEFNKKASKKDGYSNYCRKCANTPVIINTNGKRICNTCHKEKELILFKKKKTFAFKCNDCFTQEDAKKVCNKCNLEKDINSFEIRKDNGKYRNECRECKQLTTNKWKNSNLEYLLIKRKEYAKSEKKKISDKKYYENKKLRNPKIKPPKQTPEERKEREKLYYLNNKEWLQKRNYEWHKQKVKTDILYNLTKKARAMISISFKRNGFTKKSRTYEILGCSYEDFKLYLESKFESWMTWENRGLYNGELQYGWDIDHIIPLSSAETEEELIKLNHFTNLQPLCSKVNRDIKRNIYEKSLTN
jgi:hypothetical protein